MTDLIKIRLYLVPADARYDSTTPTSPVIRLTIRSRFGPATRHPPLHLPILYPEEQGQKNEVTRIVCQADSGSFVFSFRGATSKDISFNSSYGYIEALLEDMGTVSDVDVFMMAGEGSPVCGQDEEVTTLVEFLQDFGPLPPARVRRG